MRLGLLACRLVRLRKLGLNNPREGISKFVPPSLIECLVTQILADILEVFDVEE